MTGFDLGPLIQDAAERHGCPVVGLLACLKAESGLDPRAERWGTWPDVSFGLGQQTAAYAPVGDGTSSPENLERVKAWLFDRRNAIETAAVHLSIDYAVARGCGDGSLLGGLVVYNYGGWPGRDSSYWREYAGNVANYRAAIEWAEGVMGV